MHLGGDEVNTNCWEFSAEIRAWMKAQGYNVTETYAYFVARAQQIAHSYGRDVVGWEEIWVCG